MVTVSQVFYAIGLILLVPLGDLVDRRRLIARLLSICTLGGCWSTLPFASVRRRLAYSGSPGSPAPFAAQGLGRQADAGRGRPATGLVLMAILASWGVLALSSAFVAGIVLGLVLLDFGVQGQNVLSQHAIYGLGSENASRVTTAYVTSNFLGGALVSAAGSVAWGTGAGRRCARWGRGPRRCRWCCG